MRDYSVQVFWLTQFLASVSCHHFFFPPGPPGPGYQYQPPQPLLPRYDFEFRGPRPQEHPEPLIINPQTIPQYQQPPIYPVRPQYTPQHYQYYRLPDQTVVVPLKTFNGFPPFIERLVQRIQTYYSIYNPIESLTRPPSFNTATTRPEVDKNKPVQAVQVMTTNKPPSESTIIGEVTATTSKTHIKNKVSTLTVFEVPPSESTTMPTTTTLPDEEGTTIPPDLGGTTEEPNFISPENASVLAAKASSGFRYQNFPLDQFFRKTPKHTSAY